MSWCHGVSCQEGYQQLDTAASAQVEAQRLLALCNQPCKHANPHTHTHSRMILLRDGSSANAHMRRVAVASRPPALPVT